MKLTTAKRSWSKPKLNHSASLLFVTSESRMKVTSFCVPRNWIEKENERVFYNAVLVRVVFCCLYCHKSSKMRFFSSFNLFLFWSHHHHRSAAILALCVCVSSPPKRKPNFRLSWWELGIPSRGFLLLESYSQTLFVFITFTAPQIYVWTRGRICFFNASKINSLW